MKRWVIPGCFVLLAACAPPPEAPVITDANGQMQIQIDPSGWTCYQQTCLLINLAGSVRIFGYYRARIPSDIDVSDGMVTPAEFARLRQVAIAAGQQRERGDND